MKPNNNQSELLNQAIESLELQQKNELRDIKNQFEKVCDSIRPINILSETISDFRSMHDVRNNVLTNVVSVATGYLSKRLILGSSQNMFKKIGGYLLQYAVTNFTSKLATPKDNNIN